MKIETKKTILHGKKLKYDTVSGVLLSNYFDIDRFHCHATKKYWKPSRGRSQENEMF